MKEAEDALIRIPRYVDSNKEPTCAWVNSQCPFLLVARFGTEERCHWPGPGGEIRPVLERRYNSIGTLVPHNDCPVWNQE